MNPFVSTLSSNPPCIAYNRIFLFHLNLEAQSIWNVRSKWRIMISFSFQYWVDCATAIGQNAVLSFILSSSILYNIKKAKMKIYILFIFLYRKKELLSTCVIFKIPWMFDWFWMSEVTFIFESVWIYCGGLIGSQRDR